LIDKFCQHRGLRAPLGLVKVHSARSPELAALLYRPGLHPQHPPSIEWAYDTISKSSWPLVRNLIPVLPVDEQSFACVVASPANAHKPVPGEGAVVRWHMGIGKSKYQAALLDVSVESYVMSVAQELQARPVGLRRMLDEIGPAYQIDYLAQSRRPRDYVVRPVRLACQNVVVGLAAFAHDSVIDGMSVVAWQACEVPHVAAHEGNRALAALMLCDAYQSGGTMEIRFDRPARVQASGKTRVGKNIKLDVCYPGHPEMSVPASLRRYGRTRGIVLGGDDPASISPREARALFLAVTPMPKGLAGRVQRAADKGVSSPEQLCFTLLSQIWREIELDYMLAVSDRIGSILRGGAAWTHRSARQAESHVCRSALMAGMLFRCLDTRDHATSGQEVRVLEDQRLGVTWDISSEFGVITFCGLSSAKLPWQAEPVSARVEPSLTVLPRSYICSEDLSLARSLRNRGPVAIVVPFDFDLVLPLTDDILILRCPDRLSELDRSIDAALCKSRTMRA
jgi:hypothetical protein